MAGKRRGLLDTTRGGLEVGREDVVEATSRARRSPKPDRTQTLI